MPTMETRVALLEERDERRGDDITEIKGLVANLDSKLNKCLLGACGVMFTAIINLIAAYSRLGK